jgi:hypothetical protein
MMSIGLRPRSLGEILDGSFRLYREDAGLLTLTTVLCFAPGVAWVTLMTVSSTGGVTGIVESLAMFLGSMVGTLIVGTALTHILDTRLQGETPGLGPAFKRGLRLALRMMWCGIILYFFALVTFLVPGFAVTMLLGLGASAPIAVQVVFGVAGVGAMALAGLWWLGQVFTVLPLMVVENLPAYAAIKRSVSLARGGWLRIGFTFIICYVLVLAPTFALMFLTGSLGSLMDPTAVGTISAGALIVQQFVGLVVAGLTMPFMVGCMLLTYYDRRIRTEAYDLEAATEALLGEA